MTNLASLELFSIPIRYRSTVPHTRVQSLKRHNIVLRLLCNTSPRIEDVLDRLFRREAAVHLIPLLHLPLMHVEVGGGCERVAGDRQTT